MFEISLKNTLRKILVLGLCIGMQKVFSQGLTLGEMSDSITQNFESLERLIGAAAYIAGLAFSVCAIMKFKQHKDNPMRIPIGTPISLVFIGAILLFLPSLLEIIEATMFGSQYFPGTP
ncbi:hypothetical protein [Legionella tunisiensis]|uniref:hypothetical protein n=1 Tax=Legionella tunisiensis TaxID=1034944 RepID=UPI0002D8030D|nr:hypothetical protein [Legionella tunisiensis]